MALAMAGCGSCCAYPEVIAVEKDASLQEVTELLLNRHIHRVFVTEEKRIIGVVTAMDALRAFSSV